MVMLCDRCSAKAVHRFSKSEREDLAFCGHHKNEYLKALSAQGFIEVVNTVGKEFAKAL